MSPDGTPGGRRRPLRLVLSLLLLGSLAGALVLVGPNLLSGLRAGDDWARWGPECTVETADGEVELTREEAKRATTAVALAARGRAVDTAGLDETVLQRLADGPPEDAGASLACRGPADGGLPEQQLTGTGLTPRAERLRAAMTEVFGEQSLGGFAPGGVDRGHGEESTHYDGRAVDVFFRPVTEENRRAGWVLAHWLVAHAEDLDVQYVIFDDRFWSAHSARGRWQDYDAPEPANEILRHLDHVHVDVLRGGAG
ncbi:hypothetical protein BJF77_05345 [Kocuria sp. CNJ-770]|uniref:hypothetical protein n=1 Tax=Kocuria sp. CNJ-770 TaxID=1904964 RepID=UPI0009610E8C|nr:hypothetical protein [Kocuria sp. CNJ-770]OLT13775.1 hypothetical protein BJF77_05345 [Kocuria sp. CNJ-770]